ncbi:UDP-glycosyltransferase 92A1-like [Cynara cardunculus var. scolymus]|uniref:Glycosyltransferase n=1 Tax=Cynara cardunculus var. scolymus TaxID=59895 RepID=A0A103YHZ4_CYNCS|nr:UDP-glycosyltransferase 92A1-like [Cynara cardunculus var. scolymus]KVI09446.1 UDP-glucuronosyl/UDP-glucosyltransferase [Cynara cardunculus var. scolymus]
MEASNNILMFPFMAQGHIIPFFALSLQLQQKGYQITFLNTPLNIANLRRLLPPSSAIRLLEIPFNSSDHGLPPHSENTDSLPPNRIYDLLVASTSLKPAFTNILKGFLDAGAPPLCVVADFFFGWSAAVSHEFGIFHVIFSGSGGFGLACYYSAWINLPHQNSDSGEFVLPDFQEAGKLQVTQLTPSLVKATDDDPLSKFQIKNLTAWANADGFLFNTIEELDKVGLSYFRRKFRRPVWAIGPINLPLNGRPRAGKSGGIDTESCLHFLNSKPPSSVLYISFGSQNTISASQMMQLAKALDKSKKSFIWVVRPPLEFNINADFRAEEWLPENFKNQMENENRGVIIEKWAAQVEILSHKSVGGFMSHCGWNSVMESLSRGVPILGWPLAAEQFYNAKMMVEIAEVCVEVARGTDFEVRSEDLREKIEEVMSETGNGKEMRKKAFEIKKIIEEATSDEEGFKGSSVAAMEDFLQAPLLIKNLATNLPDNY